MTEYMDNMEETLDRFKINLSPHEKAVCLKEIIKKNKKILYVYEQTLIPNSNYNYKVYVGSLLLYVSSSNEFFNDGLINILINLSSIMNNDFDKSQIKKLVHENTNILEHLLTEVGE